MRLIRARVSRKTLTYLGLMVFSVLFLWIGNRLATRNNPYFAGATLSEDYYLAEVTEVSEVRTVLESLGGYQNTIQTVDLKIRLLSGFLKGEIQSVNGQRIEANSPARFYPYQPGDRVYATFNFDSNDQPFWYIADHARGGPLLFLAGAFLLLLILFGRRQGVNTVITLLFTMAAIFFVLIPAVLNGANIYLLTLAVSAFIIVMTLGIVIGPHIKSAAAAAGCAGGVGVAGALTVVMQNVMKISGLVDEESSFVLFINPDHPIDLKGVIFGAIAIGALGAVMDVAMSIASSLDELVRYTPALSPAELVRSGMRIGRDIMGTMANTLVLAYVGSSLNVILLLFSYNRSLSSILNREMVAVEVLQSVAGSLGILCAVPATALCYAAFHALRLKRNSAQGSR
ncbi:MAG: YibE/F family protein [Provencibacterium sp.]|jgi:uncharacterized membrane protein|nr:YibE/F family protein [Provencibacterium sp.]